MSPMRMTNQMFTYFDEYKTKGVWITVVIEDLQEMGIKHQDIQGREPLKRNLEHTMVVRESLI